MSSGQTNQNPNEKLLWENGAPDAQSDSNEDKPMLFIYPASQSNNSGSAVIICPGGAYTRIAIDHEGHDVAKWFNEHGISAFVLRYRKSPYRHPIPLNDVKRAMRTVRYLASQYSIDTTRIGISGFSAGGHLASTLLTHFDKGDANNTDPIEREKSRPDFGILIYPVITMTGEYIHRECRNNLLGNSPSVDLVKDLSNHLQVTKKTPPTFLAHGDKDESVPLTHSILFDFALSANNLLSELFIDQGKGHGYGLDGKWPEACIKWMKRRGI